MATKKELEKLIVSIEADTRKLRKGLKVSERQVRKSASKMVVSFRAVTAATASAAATVATLGAAAAAAAVGGILLGIKNTLEWADELSKFSAQVGVSTDYLQELEYAARLSGVGVDTLRSALDKMQTKTGRAGGAFGTLANDLTKLDPVLLAQIKNADSLEERFDLVIQRVGEYTDVAKRSSVLEAIFGGQGRVIARMVDDYKNLLAEAKRLGIVIPNEKLTDAVKTIDSMTRLTESLKAKFRALSLNKSFQENLRKLVDLIVNELSSEELEQKLTAFAASVTDTAKAIAELAGVTLEWARAAGLVNSPIPNSFGGIEREAKNVAISLNNARSQLDRMKRHGAEPLKIEDLEGKIQRAERRMAKLQKRMSAPEFKSWELGKAIEESDAKIVEFEKKYEEMKKLVDTPKIMNGFELLPFKEHIPEFLRTNPNQSDALFKERDKHLRKRLDRLDAEKRLNASLREQKRIEDSLIEKKKDQPGQDSTDQDKTVPSGQDSTDQVDPKRNETLEEYIRLIDAESTALGKGKAAYDALMAQRALAKEQEQALQSLKEKGLELTPTEIARVNEQIAARAEAREEAKRMFETQTRLNALLGSTQTAEQKLAEDIQFLTEQFTLGRISIDEYASALDALGKKRQEAMKGSGKESTGLMKSFQDQLKGIQKSGDLLAASITQIGDNMVDTMLDGGKFGESMKEMFKGLVKNILKAIVAQLILRSLLGVASVATGGTFAAGFASGLAGTRASGGSVTGNSAYLVGEKGPEIFVPKVSGGIVPNHKLGSVGGGTDTQINVIVNNNAQGTETRVEEGTNANGEREARVFIESIAVDSMTNGKLGRATQQRFKNMKTQTIAR